MEHLPKASELARDATNKLRHANLRSNKLVLSVGALLLAAAGINRISSGNMDEARPAAAVRKIAGPIAARTSLVIPTKKEPPEAVSTKKLEPVLQVEAPKDPVTQQTLDALAERLAKPESCNNFRDQLEKDAAGLRVEFGSDPNVLIIRHQTTDPGKYPDAFTKVRIEKGTLSKNDEPIKPVLSDKTAMWATEAILLDSEAQVARKYLDRYIDDARSQLNDEGFVRTSSYGDRARFNADSITYTLWGTKKGRTKGVSITAQMDFSNKTPHVTGRPTIEIYQH